MSNSQQNLIWGVHPVLEMIRTMPDRITELTVQKPGKSKKIVEIIELAEKKRLRVKLIDRISIAGNPEANHQGIVARIKHFPTWDLDDLLADAKSDGGFLVALDSIQDPHNLGAIIRSAAAAGAAGILLPKDRSAPLSGTAAKVAAGSLSHIKVCLVTNLSDSLKTLQNDGYWIYGADGSAEQSIYEVDLSGKVCLVIGSEGKGIRPLVKKQCDFLVKIPINSKVESLNASVAAAIIFFEIARQKKHN